MRCVSCTSSFTTGLLQNEDNIIHDREDIMLLTIFLAAWICTLFQV